MDYIYRVESLPGDAETADTAGNEVSGMEPEGTWPGGSSANTVYGLAKLGISTGFIGTVGDDSDGRKMLEDFRSVGTDTGGIKTRHGVKTGNAKCLVDSRDHRSIRVSPEANSLLSIEDIDVDYVNNAELIHISSFVDEKQYEMLLGLMQKISPEVKVSFSPGALWASKGIKALSPVLKRAYVLFLNGDEIRQMTGQDMDKGAARCLELGCRIVAVTLGKGQTLNKVTAAAYIRDTGGEYIIERTEELKVADTTGAGDAFAAGFLYGLLEGKNMKECGLLGDTVARFSIAGNGARQGLPTREQLAGCCRSR
jgi:ribokinase